MSASVDEVVGEGIRLVRTQERVAALIAPMEMMFEQVNGILDSYPELAPEMRAILDRLSETTDHVRAALAIIETKVGLL